MISKDTLKLLSQPGRRYVGDILLETTDARTLALRRVARSHGRAGTDSGVPGPEATRTIE